MRKTGMWQKYLRLLLLLCTISVTMPLLPGTSVNVYGMFGEVQAFTTICDAKEELAEIAAKIKEHVKTKGANLFNLWLILEAIISCMIFEMCIFCFPKGDTIVARKVRMDD